MKHELNSQVIFKQQQEIVKQIVEKSHSEFNTDDYQLSVMIHPIVGNAEFNRVQKELENERFVTLIKLARVFDNETLSKTINVLGYTLNVK